jgi:flagellar motor switch protein FliG
LERLDDQALATLMQSADPEVTILALAGASEPFVERILGQFRGRESRLLRRQMEQLSPLRLSDVAHAQQRLVQHASQLASDGVIEIPKVKRFAVAA